MRHRRAGFRANTGADLEDYRRRTSEHRADDYLFEPAEALDAIRRFDLSRFDWCPTNEDQFRDFLARYVPPSVMQSVMQFTQPGFDEFLGAWKPDSPWCPTFMSLVAHARFGAVRAYEFLIKEEARAAKRKERLNGSPEALICRHKGNGTIQ